MFKASITSKLRMWSLKSKAYKPARTTIQYCRQIHVRPVSDRQVGNVTNIKFVESIGVKPAAYKVSKHVSAFGSHGGFYSSSPGIPAKAYILHDPGHTLVV